MPTTGFAANAVPGRRSGIKDTAMMLIGYALHPLQTRRWLQYINSVPALREMARTAPALRTRLHQPYLSPGLSCADRVGVLMEHYDVLLHSPLADVARKAALQPLSLGEFVGRSGTVYQLALSAGDASRRDGDLVLRLHSRGLCIYTAAFVLLRRDGIRHVKLGGLQGMLATDRSMGIKQITRDLYGCRPRELMIAIVREIGRAAECSKLILISNANKLPPTDKHVCRKSSDYDAIWKEMHAARRSDGDFELPCTDEAMVRMSEAAASRRAMLIESVLDLVRLRLAQDRAAAAWKAASQASEPPLTPGMLRRSDIGNSAS